MILLGVNIGASQMERGAGALEKDELIKQVQDMINDKTKSIADRRKMAVAAMIKEAEIMSDNSSFSEIYKDAEARKISFQN